MKKFLSIVLVAVSLLAFGSCKKTENAGQNRSVVYFNDIKIDDPVCIVADWPDKIYFYILLAPDLAVKASGSFRTIYIQLNKESLGKTLVVSLDPKPETQCLASYEEQPLSGKVTANSVDDHPGHFIIDFDFDLNFKGASGSFTTERVIKFKGHVDKVFQVPDLM